MNELYVTLKKDGYSSIEEKKSTFLGYAKKVTSEEEANAFVEKIRCEHRDARHNVYAYVLFSGAMKCSDDGEPQGTGGIPLLSAIEKAGVSDTVIVVTRYFGGILLGAPGLLRAYSAAASAALLDAGKSVSELFDVVRTELSYSDYNRLISSISELECKIDSSEYNENVVLTLAVKSEQTNRLSALINEKTAGKSSIQIIAQRYDSI